MPERNFANRTLYHGDNLDFLSNSLSVCGYFPSSPTCMQNITSNIREIKPSASKAVSMLL